jgi:hypothetical protein
VGQASPWENLQGQVLLGDDAFVERLQPGLRERREIKEIPRKQRVATRPALAELFSPGKPVALRRRNEVIRQAHVEYGYSLSEIGRTVGLHYSTISRIVNGDTGRDTQSKT